MIKNARVNISAVKKFYESVADVKDYAPKFDKGISCIERMQNSLGEMGKSIESDVISLQKARNVLDVKIRNVEGIIFGIETQINELEAEKSGLENELSGMDASYTTTDENGETHEYSNPAYVELNAKIEALEDEISQIEDELYPQRQRLERANSVRSQILSHLDEINSVLYSLAEKKNTCKNYITKMEEVKNRNDKKSTYAFENLKKIEQIVSAYMRIKMTYDSASSSANMYGSNRIDDININININQRPIQNQVGVSSEESDAVIPNISVAEIKKHGIKFDAEKHISEYDGKTFGGKYNSYKYRIDRTSRDDNPVHGYYIGTRGESKYIPSGRSAEGIVVIGILKKYGLDGIEYRNGEPDFEVCAEAVVKIPNMTEIRYNYIDSDGNSCLGNFSQADIELAKIWNFEEREGRTNWEPSDVCDYRAANGLTWHEKCDTETMVLVKREINGYFKHIGGCSECRLRDAGNNEGGFDE